MAEQPLTERIYLKDMTCPLIRLDKSRRKDKSVSFSISLCVHLLIFSLVGISFIKPPQFGVDRGVSGMEVNLIAAVPEVPVVETPVETVPEPIKEVKSDFVEKVVVKPVPISEAKKESTKEIKGKDEITAQSSGGAISEAKPDYLKNPAPAYPESARRKGYEGTVMLIAVIDRNGNAIKVDIEKSSGYRDLDQAALKAVKAWRFSPGKLGAVTVESSVHVPVRFDLTTINK